MTSRLFFLVSLIALVPACGSPAETPDGGTPPDDAALDAPAPDDGAMPDGFVPADAPRADAPPDAPPPIDAGMPIEALRDGICAAFAEASCRHRYDCGCSDERIGPEPFPGIDPPPEGGAGGGGPDPGACISALTEGCASDLRSRLEPLFATGRLRYDPAAIESCRTRVDAAFAACAGTNADVTQWCQGMLIESAAIGAPCEVREALCADGAGYCADGGTCQMLPGLSMECGGPGVCAADLTCRDGTCVELSDEGEPCTRDGNCAGDGVCAGGTCRASRAAIGSACDADADCVAHARCEKSLCVSAPVGATCETDDECGSLQRCEERFGRLCRDPSPVGGECTSSSACTADAYCDTSTTFPGVCRTRVGVGSPCPNGDECEPGAICDFSTGAPLCRSPAGAGEACAGRFGGPEGNDGCQPDLSCVMGTCRTYPGAGELCADDGECAPGLACRTSPIGERRCGAPGTGGESCEPFGGFGSSECELGLFCDSSTGFGTCRPQRALGEACNGDLAECHDGLSCIRRSDGSATCSPIPGAGEECADACTGGLACADGELPGACAPTVCDEIPGGGVIEPPPPPPRPVPTEPAPAPEG